MLPCPSLHNDSISVEWGNEAVRIVLQINVCAIHLYNILIAAIFSDKNILQGIIILYINIIDRFYDVLMMA